MSEIIFCRSPPAAETSTLTFLHFAASDRTAAYDSCDQALIPKPSSTDSVIGLVPQNAILLKLPAFAISCAAVGHAAAFRAGEAVADTAAQATTTSMSAASVSPRGLRSAPSAPLTNLLVIVDLLDPGDCRNGARLAVLSESSSAFLGRRGVIDAGRGLE